ncbi:hypothetical protein [Hyphobacterium sp.]|uniref:hypothetical protein n=1 Tax=Hyphobacterium sp. TaxID=2004662 RepID=UPI003BAD9278
MTNRFGIGIGTIVASGLTTLTFVTFLGAVFPAAPNDVARTHLIIAVILPFFGFITAVLLTASAYLLSAARLAQIWILLPQLVSAAFNFVLLVMVTNQTTAALSQWFETGTGSSEDIDWIIRAGLAVGVLAVIVALTVFSVRHFSSSDARKSDKKQS